MSFLHGVDSDTSDATFGFYFLLALKMLEKHNVISAHCTHGGRRLNIVMSLKKLAKMKESLYLGTFIQCLSSFQLKIKLAKVKE